MKLWACSRMWLKNLNKRECQSLNIIMTDEMTKEEWDEMNVLRKAISEHPASVAAHKQERFTELFVKSLAYVVSPESK